MVEADADILDLTVATLTNLGCRALAASDAGVALQLLDAAPNVALLLTDIRLRGKFRGLDLAKRASALRPGIKVLLTTEYVDPRELRTASPYKLGEFPVLRKFYQREELACKIRSVFASGVSH